MRGLHQQLSGECLGKRIKAHQHCVNIHNQEVGPRIGVGDMIIVFPESSTNMALPWSESSTSGLLGGWRQW